MSGDRTEFEDDPPADPFEAELVAYLDGELDAAAMRKVEARLATDPAARARAAELKKSYDLLDFLPRPEPSPDFATRTLDKIPALQTASGSAPRAAAPRAARSGSDPVFAHTASASYPIPLPDPGRARSGGFLKAAALLVAVAGCAAAGYFATALAKPYLAPTREKEVGTEEPKVPTRIIEHLPLYAVADDLVFVQELASPKLFGDDPAVAFDRALKVPPVDTADHPTAKEVEALTRAFRALPAARQAEILKFDQELHAKEPKERDRLFRVLEAYAAWLDRLPEGERRGVLSAATPALRLGVVHDLRERQWTDALPAAVRTQLDALTDPKLKAQLSADWKADEAAWRDRLAFVRQHAELFASNRSPFPFDTEAGQKDVKEFMRAAFKLDDPKRLRLTGDELREYRSLLLQAEAEKMWAWYGLRVYELNQLRPFLPEPENAKLLVTEPTDLPDVFAQALVGKKAAVALWRPKLNVVGKWPEFPLEVLKEVRFPLKLGSNPPPLGPARVAEFKPAVRAFADKELFPKLTADEKAALQRLEGKWPEYPREFVRLAHKHDLSVPGVSLPGSPRKWDETYGTRLGLRPNP